GGRGARHDAHRRRRGRVPGAVPPARTGRARLRQLAAPGVRRRARLRRHLPGRILMRVVVVGAGAVGASIARELLSHQHEVVIFDEKPEVIGRSDLRGAQWIIGDACELSTLREGGLEETDVVVAATGDDKANLVVSLLARSEFGVPRTVGRVNNPKNEWLFDDAWGVDVAVSTPRLMTALVEEAVEVGDVVR